MIVAAIVLVIVERRRGPWRWVALYLAVVIVGQNALTRTIKELADRVRPDLNPIAETLGPSFPSGHSATAAAFWAAAALVLGAGRPRLTRALLAGGAVGITVGVAGSRVLLDVHWLSDVIAGVALGWGWFAACSIAFGGRVLRFGAAAERAGEQAVAEAGTPQGSRGLLARPRPPSATATGGASRAPPGGAPATASAARAGRGAVAADSAPAPTATGACAELARCRRPRRGSRRAGIGKLPRVRRADTVLDGDVLHVDHALDPGESAGASQHRVHALAPERAPWVFGLYVAQ